jgi:phosphatidylglycerol lysyltransferase
MNSSALPQNDLENTSNEPLSLKLTRELVLTHGWNSTSFQIINPGIKRWFSEANDSVVGFVSCNGVRVTVGAPVCEKSRLPEITAEYELDAEKDTEKVCYVCAEERLESIYTNSTNHTKVLLGAQPVWNPANWDSIVTKYKSLRAQLNRARNKSVKVSEWSSAKAQNNPALLECLQVWLSAKNLPPLRFMVEPNTLARLANRRIFVAECGGEVIGFVLLSPVPKRNGWLFEQFPHKPGAPNGTVELMIDFAMRVLAEGNYEYATLGLSPLSSRAQIKPFQNPLWLRVLLAWMKKHGQRFYNFDGLDSFKAKLQPESWEPIFAISNERKTSVKTLYAITSAFSGNKTISFIFSGLYRAFRTELNWIWKKVKNI